MRTLGADCRPCANPVTLNNLRRGIQQLMDRHGRQGKPTAGDWDFHNALYRRLEAHRLRGLDHSFWDFLVQELWNWRAIRGGPQHTKSGIRSKGLECFADLQGCFFGLARKAGNDLPTVDTLGWDDVEPLFRIAHQIKAVPSPTFASKLCHFLVPGAYFVTDATLVKVGWKDYRTYWEECRAAWLQASDKHILKDELRTKIPDEPCATYPWATKITELCQFQVRS